MKIPTSRRRKRNPAYLEGQLLIAMPQMSDRRFARAVIYLCAHSDEGAMGLIINQRSAHIGFTDLLKRLDIKVDDDDGIADDILSMPVHVGGPVETGRGFVLHTNDYVLADTTALDDGVCLTATLDILKAIATGKGPARSILALGYSGWSPGQLESEIQANGWLHCAADKDLIFDPDLDAKYGRALAKIGGDPSHLVADAGHA